MNNVSLIGNLTRDPELRYSTGANQTAICRFTLAVNDGYGEKQRTNFIPIVVFGKQAENCERFLKKGRLVGVQGRLQTGSYTNKDGATVYTTDVVADRVEFLEWGDRQSSNDGFGQAMSAPREAAPQSAPAAQDDFTPEGFTAIEEDIPF